MKETRSQSRCLAAGLGFCLAVAGIRVLAAEHSFDGIYTGKRELTKGSASAACPREDDVSVAIHGDTLTFTDGALKKFTQPFYPGPNGSFGQTYTDEGGAVVRYHGRIAGNVMDADVTNLSCEYHWHLKKG